jgi:tetratricopeptide (TPR) repeat protein
MLAAFYADTGYQLETGGLDYIEQASQDRPDDADIQASLGWAYYQLGDINRAYQALNRAVGLNPASPRSRYYFGAVLEAMGDRDGAADSFRYVVDEVGVENGFGLLAARALARLGVTP